MLLRPLSGANLSGSINLRNIPLLFQSVASALKLRETMAAIFAHGAGCRDSLTSRLIISVTPVRASRRPRKTIEKLEERFTGRLRVGSSCSKK